MNLKDFTKSKKELEKQIEKNNQPFLHYDEQYRMARTNQSEYKIWTTLFFSLVSYLVFVIGSAISLSITDAPLFSSVPRLIYPAVVLGSTVGLGTVARIWMEKKFKLTERLRAFTSAKTDSEKLVEEIKNEIELQKIKTRNLALSKAIEQLKEDEKKLRSVSEKYIISDKEEKNQKNSKEKVASLILLLQEKYALLDSLVTKKVIGNKFFHQRQKGQGIMDTIIAIGGSGVGALMYYTLTLMLASTHVALPLVEGTTGLLVFFAPAILSGTVAGLYYNVRNKNYQKAFATINETLKDEALPSKSKDTYEERQVLENLIEKTISEIVSATIKLQEERRYLDSFNIEDLGSTSLEEPTLTKDTPVFEQTIEEIDEQTYMEEPTKETLSPDSEHHSEIKTLAKKRKTPYQN